MRDERQGTVNRRAFLGTTAAATAGMALSSRAPAQAGRRPPNIVFIHTDQQSSEAMSAHGNPSRT